uniref:FAD/NAD(P)-binding domain-containing protein n=1 Tax=Globisporangium ultimum (strain ATCC 200006 / CBS 805.95 / DAOM BR144) TaxID=431595 RepID=K3WXL9_GLOUD
MRLTRRFTRRRQKKTHKFVIVGSGTAAHAAIEAIRQEDPEADILVLSDENALPRLDTDPYTSALDDDYQIAEPLMQTYNEWRRHLTAKLETEPSDNNIANGNNSNSNSSTFLPPLTLLLGNKEMRFDAEKNRICLGDGTEIRYEKCLIASSAAALYVLDSNRISYSLKDRINRCTTLTDFTQLDQLHKRPEIKSVTVIGGGFLGTEVATALATDPRNAELTTRLVFTESAPMSRSLPFYLAQELTTKLQRIGVDVVPDHLVTSLKCEGDADECEGVIVEGLGKGKMKLHSDYVVLASTHTDPNFRFGRDSCLEVDDVNGGIMVNAQLEAISGLFVAGNAASYYDPYLGRRRVDRYDHAVNSGLVAGRNMAASLSSSTGKMKNYRHQPMFRSHLQGIDVVIEGIGEINSSLRTIGLWVQPRNSSIHTRQTGMSSTTPPANFERGIVYYLKGNKIMGILLWNASDVLESAKQLMLSRPEMHDNVVEELQHVISIAPTDWLHVITT